MKYINDSPNHPARFECDGKTIGQFYNSWDKTYHLSSYVPYTRLPSRYLCGKTGNFSPSRKEYERNKCVDCWKHVEYITQGSNHDCPV